MTQAFATKALISMVAAVLMYWMQLPQPIILLMIMMGLDLMTGVINSLVQSTFNGHRLWIGVLRKAITFPVLAACHVAEGPLHLWFDLDSYVALVLVVYYFQSVIVSYARAGGPVPDVLLNAAEKARKLLASSANTARLKVLDDAETARKKLASDGEAADL